MSRSGGEADAVARLLLGVAERLRERADDAIVHLGLTPATARALAALDPDRPEPARELAGKLSCDRSNITGLVDRLEEAGLVRRQPAATDRRIKTLVVTDTGRQLRSRVEQVFAQLTAALDVLTPAELGQLAGQLEKIDAALG
jgi:DNA-binding MarR family transcriptional regulator